MTDELLLRRLRIGWHDDDTPILVSDAMTEAAARIEALTAENARLRAALEDIITDCKSDYPPSHGAIRYAAQLALKGESHE